MTRWLYLVAIAGCGFTAGLPGEQDTSTDAGDQADGSTPIPITRNCALTDPALRLCIDFEDPATLTDDASGHGNQAVRADGLVVTSRGAEQAALLDSQTRVLIAEHADLDITEALTVSMWMKADAPASGSSFWMLDNNTQYSMSLQPGRVVRCGLGTETIDATAWLDGSWHHVACTYDRTQLKVVIDGSIAGCRAMTRAIATTGNEGLAIGANVDAGPVFSRPFIGGLDNIQVFARAQTPAELCTAAGKTSCWSQCIGESDGGSGGGLD